MYDIFYVDDDIDDLQFFLDVASEIEVKVRAFQDAAMMIVELDQTKNLPKMVYVDLNLPRVDGYEAIKRIREKFTTLPIVVLTTGSSAAISNKSWEIGANYFISKPTSTIKLREAIKKTMKIDWDRFPPGWNSFVHKF